MTFARAMPVVLLSTVLSGCSPHEHSQLPPIDHIVVSKTAHILRLERKGQVLRSYEVAIGRGGASAKHRAGDHLTPEGEYRIDGRWANSRFHKALHLSYPNAEDSRRAAALHVSAGGDIEIHGLQNGLVWIGGAQHLVDWTDGCIAVTDKQIDEIWQAAPIGTAVTIEH